MKEIEQRDVEPPVENSNAENKIETSIELNPNSVILLIEEVAAKAYGELEAQRNLADIMNWQTLDHDMIGVDPVLYLG